MARPHLRLVPTGSVRPDTDSGDTLQPFDRAGWEDHLATTGLATATTAQYRALGQRLADHLEDGWRQPRPAQVREWSDTLAPSRSMRDQARSTVREYCLWLGVDPEPCRQAVWRPAKTPRPRWRSLPDATVRDLLAAAARFGREGTAVLLGLYCALRRSEIAGVRWDRVDLEAAQAEVWRPKNRDWHLVPLHPLLVERLTVRQLPLDGPGVPWLFPGRWGGHVSPATVATWVGKVAAAAGHPGVSPHDLRHTAATKVYDQTLDLVLTQTLLGHQRPETTGRYVRPNRQAVADAVRRLDWAA